VAGWDSGGSATAGGIKIPSCSLVRFLPLLRDSTLESDGIKAEGFTALALAYHILATDGAFLYPGKFAK
jgi:hypothetical protein